MSPNPNPKPAVIRMQGATVSSLRDATHPVLENVNWTVWPGEFWVVAGRQHSGKTDLLMMTAGMTPPVEGSHQLFGLETRELGEAEVAERLRVGFVFDHGRLFNQMTIAENVALPLRYHRDLDEAAAEGETRTLLEWLELATLADRNPLELSRDWLKRAALARALVLRPHLLLCDQPLDGLSARHRQWWLGFLDQLGRGHEQLGGEPVTVVVTTEDLAPWKSPVRRFAWLRENQFIPLGGWPEVAGAGDPALKELLPANEPTP